MKENDKTAKNTVASESARQKSFNELRDAIYHCLLDNGKIESEQEFLYFTFLNQKDIKSFLRKLGF